MHYTYSETLEARIGHEWALTRESMRLGLDDVRPSEAASYRIVEALEHCRYCDL
ncbi:MAG: hypothetical protein K9L32_10260 [Chromatiaceae bacterium]|nr:hypothetical protein [Chromatiaceae bacterium]MCF8004567.1 hypothetical protein [Chromatiaceae bacterium]MCF8015264.1 hypothetical protein [Chromatiaceae bacterium]